MVTIESLIAERDELLARIAAATSRCMKGASYHLASDVVRILNSDPRTFLSGVWEDGRHAQAMTAGTPENPYLTDYQPSPDSEPRG